MNTDPLDNDLRQLAWRRALTPAEKEQLAAWLVRHPEAQPDWESEAALTRALLELPDVPVPSNFTQRVLRAVELEEKAALRTPTLGWRAWLTGRWLPRVAFAGLFLCASVLAYHHAQVTQRKAMAQDVVVVSEVASVTSPEAMADFDAIQALKSAPAPDEELLSLLK